MNTNIPYDDENIFAKILRNEAKAEIVYETKNVLCFNDMYPKAPVHILIIPKGRFKDINDFSKNANTEQKIDIFASFEILIDKFKLNTDGCRILTNFGTNGRQEVPHLHFHIVGGKDVGRMFN
ncbi:HIT domain-containing protein [Alphaproteobacteria bacterium]|nr:HIT domain-containing protein [Alphaproteobacteria bacterium]